MSREHFDSELLARNCAALAEINPEFAARLGRLEPSAAVFALPTPDGAWTMTVGGRQVLSKYAPNRDVQRLVRPELEKSPKTKILIVLGFEVGAVARALLAGTEAQLFVVEPDAGALVAALGAVDLTAVLNQKRLHLVEGVEKLYFHPDYTYGMKPDLVVLALPGYRQAYAAELARLHQRVTDLVHSQDVVVYTNLVQQRRWFSQLFDNFRDYVFLPTIARLRNAFAGVPAVIVAAGPRLDKHVPLLKQWQDRGLIVSLGTSLRKCVSIGVTPPITIAIEAQDIMRQCTDIAEVADTYTFFQFKCFAELWRLPALGTFTFISNHLDAKWLVERLGHEDIMLEIGGSVATAAYKLALYLGCDPVVFIGQDLAFGEAGQSHADGIGTGGVENITQQNMTQMLTNKESEDKGLVVVDGYYGKPVVTKTNLRNYLMWFEEQIPQALREGKRVINATEGGACIRPAQQMSFAEATATFLGEPLNVRARLAQFDQPPELDLDRVGQEIAHTLRQLREMIELARSGRERAHQVQQLMSKKPMPVEKINKLIHHIDRDEAKLKDVLITLNPLISSVANQATLIVKTCFDYSGLSREDTVRLNMKHTATMYAGLLEAAEIVGEKLERLQHTIRELSDPAAL